MQVSGRQLAILICNNVIFAITEVALLDLSGKIKAARQNKAGYIPLSYSNLAKSAIEFEIL